MKKLIVIGLLLATASAAIWKSRQPELETLGAAAASVRAKSQASRQPGETTADLEAGASAEELKRLRAVPGELARLRGTVSSLRQRTNQTPEQVEARATETLAEAGLVRARREAREQSKRVAGSLGMCMMFTAIVAGKTGGAVPASWEEVQKRLDDGAQAGDPMLGNLKSAFAHARQTDGGLRDFEIMAVPPDTRVEPRQVPPALPLLRERQPRPQPDGGAARFYGWLNRRTEEVVLKDGNFAAWEAEHFRPGVARVTND